MSITAFQRICTAIVFALSIFSSPAFGIGVVTIKYRDTPVNLDCGKFEHYSKESSFINGAWYDDDASYLVLLLNTTFYQYCNVPSRIWQEYRNSFSLGKYFNANIKSKFGCQRGSVPTYP